jgi:hypothetical protein
MYHHLGHWPCGIRGNSLREEEANPGTNSNKLGGTEPVDVKGVTGWGSRYVRDEYIPRSGGVFGKGGSGLGSVGPGTLGGTHDKMVGPCLISYWGNILRCTSLLDRYRKLIKAEDRC